MVVLDSVHASVVRAPSATDTGRTPLPAPTGRGPFRPDSLYRKYPPPLLGQLGTRLGVGVEEREVADNDGNGQSDGQHTGQCTQGAHKHACKYTAE